MLQQHPEVMQLFDRLQREFGNTAPHIIQVIVQELGGLRLRIPDMDDLWRKERNRRVRLEFNGNNHQELAFKYRIHPQHVRRILRKE